MGILRGVEIDVLEPLIEAVIPTGLLARDITMNTAGATKIIRCAVELSKGRLMIGAGSVLDM